MHAPPLHRLVFSKYIYIYINYIPTEKINIFTIFLHFSLSVKNYFKLISNVEENSKNQ